MTVIDPIGESAHAALEAEKPHLPRVLEAAASGAIAGAVLGFALMIPLSWTGFHVGKLPPPPTYHLWLIPLGAGFGAVLVGADRWSLLLPRATRPSCRLLGGSAACFAGALPAASAACLMRGELPWQGARPGELLLGGGVLFIASLLFGGAFALSSLFFDHETGWAADVKRFTFTGALLATPFVPVAGGGAAILATVLGGLLAALVILTWPATALVEWGSHRMGLGA